MLWDVSTIIGCTILGRDGEGGRVTDLLFDDSSWRMRWIVVNTHYCFRREILLPMSGVVQPEILNRRLRFDLTIRQIEDSLPLDRKPPVSHGSARAGEDPHLRSVGAVIGHRVHLTDGVIGHVEDLLVQEADWSIRFFRVDTCRWLPDERVLLAPRFVNAIDWPGRLVRFDLRRSEIEADRTDRDVIWMRSRAEGSRPDV